MCVGEDNISISSIKTFWHLKKFNLSIAFTHRHNKPNYKLYLVDISICKHKKFLLDFLDPGKFWLHFLRYIGTVLWSTRSKNLVKPPHHKLWDWNKWTLTEIRVSKRVFTLLFRPKMVFVRYRFHFNQVNDD